MFKKKKLRIPIEGDCTGCIFAQPVITEDDDLIGKCRRYPPQIYVDAEGDTCQSFPDTHYKCGEYQKVD